MKDVRNWIILILLIIVIIGAIHTYNKYGKTEVSNLKEKLDSALKPHRESIIKIRAHEKVVMGKIKKDSIEHLKESEASRKEISSLRKQLKAVKYTGNPATVPDDSVKIAMQAAKEAPIKDSLISAYEKENVSLNGHIKEMQVDYSQLLDLSQQESNQKDKIINDWKAYSEGLEKENKKLRRRGIGNGIKIGVVTGVVMYIIGLSQ